jgi:N-acetylneuraminic acid mutarotase
MRAPVIAIGLTIFAACGGDDGPAGGPDASAVDAVVVGCPTTSPWAVAPPLARGPTQETAAVAVGGKLYVLGGFDERGAVLADVQIFDPATCAWSAGPSLPAAVHHANAAVVDGTIYVVGAMMTISFRAIGDVWALTPGVDATWRPRTAMPAGSERGAAVVGVIGGRIVVAGGLRGGAVAEVSAYDPVADVWDRGLPPLPEPRDHACGGAIGDALYVAGGRRGSIGSIAATTYAWTAAGGWSTRAAMPTARGGTACGVSAGRLIVVGGEGNPATATGVFAEVEAFDAAADRWTALAPMPTPRHGLAAAVIDGRLHVPGGADRQAFAAVATHEVLTP